METGVLIHRDIDLGEGTPEEDIVLLVSRLFGWASLPYVRDFGVILRCDRLRIRTEDDRYSVGFDEDVCIGFSF